MKTLLLVLICCLVAVPLFAETHTVERVIDGDTLLLTNGERVRLIGIDCPESKDNAKAQRDSERTGQDIETITTMGQKATEFAKELVEGEKVRLEFDVQQRDKYGRLLAYVYIQETVLLPLFLNATIVAEGYASPMTIPPNVKHAEVFQQLYQEARKNKLGLWRDE
ncbi:thermonuclease family protein [Candidatus Omnitrophota bacterium]